VHRDDERELAFGFEGNGVDAFGVDTREYGDVDAVVGRDVIRCEEFKAWLFGRGGLAGWWIANRCGEGLAIGLC
jgi:hypothetical protein